MEVQEKNLRSLSHNCLFFSEMQEKNSELLDINSEVCEKSGLCNKTS